MPFAIMRFAKRKSGSVGGICKHHERQKEKYESNPDIDNKRTAQNYHIVHPRESYREEISRRINDAGCKTRKDSVLFIDTLITASPEFFEQHSPQENQMYFERAVSFLAQEVGGGNIISAVVHMDERTPHMHLCFTPITSDKRLCAKEIIGNRDKLVWWQDRFHEHMSAAFPELERGEPAIETKRKHMPVRIYKQAIRLDEDMALIKQELEGINPLNAQRKKKEIADRLAGWIPAVNKFEAQLQPFKNQLAVMKENQHTLQQKYERENVKANQSKAKQHQLQQQLWDYEEFVRAIPDDLREELRQRFQREQNFEAEARLRME